MAVSQTVTESRTQPIAVCGTLTNQRMKVHGEGLRDKFATPSKVCSSDCPNILRRPLEDSHIFDRSQGVAMIGRYASVG